MKIKHWLYIMLIFACVAGLFGYRYWDSLRADTLPPSISFTVERPELSVTGGEAALLADVTATDRADGDVTASLVVEDIRLDNEQGLATVTYAAFDGAGNVAKASRQVQYTDYAGPRFCLSAPLLFSSGYDLLQHISAVDPMDGDISNRIRATSLDDDTISEQGIHDVLLRVTNSLGHTVELTVPVEVGGYMGYAAEMELTEYLVYLEQGAEFSAESWLKSFSAGKTKLALEGAVPEGYRLAVTGTVDTAVPGVYAVRYELTQNGSGYTAVSKLIVVVEA